MANKQKILIVEDEVIVSEDLKGILTGLDFEVVGQAVSGEEAIRMAHECIPNLILMDIFLKGKMDGITAAQNIRSSLDIPIIFVSAFSDEKLLERAKITEPFGYVVKPFQLRQLASCIKMALYKHEMEQKMQNYANDMESAKIAYEKLAREMAESMEKEKGRSF